MRTDSRTANVVAHRFCNSDYLAISVATFIVLVARFTRGSHRIFVDSLVEEINRVFELLQYNQYKVID